MDCIIVAGGRPGPEDPLYPYTKGQPKGMVLLAGIPMLAHVLNAYYEARAVEVAVVSGIEESESGPVRAHLSPEQQVYFLPDQGGIVSNARQGLSWLAEQRPATECLIGSGDIPLLTGAIVDAFVEQCRPFDHLAYYNVVTRQTMEARFPHSNRTFVRLQAQEIAGGDMILAQTRILHTNQALWEALSNARKHAWQLARIVGLRTLLKLLLHRLPLAEVEQLATRMFGGPIRVVDSPYAELAMDVDKPSQLALLRAELEA